MQIKLLTFYNEEEGHHNIKRKCFNLIAQVVQLLKRLPGIFSTRICQKFGLLELTWFHFPIAFDS